MRHPVGRLHCPPILTVWSIPMEWPLFCHVANRAKRFNDMLDRLDVDPLKLVRLRHGEANAEARDACLRCREAQTCAAWIELAPRGARPDFCPSVVLFESVKRS